jgi:hypothetical protein
VELIKQLSSEGPVRCDSDWIKQTPMAGVNKVLRIMLTREMDRYARDFLNCHPEAVVVCIGCGLDSRFDLSITHKLGWLINKVPSSGNIL